MTSVERIDIDDPDVDMDEGLRLLYKGGLYTGETEEFMGNVRVSLETYADGVSDGPSFMWFQDGTLQSVATFRKGRQYGEAVAWHSNGVRARRLVFGGAGAPVSDESWDESGRITSRWSSDEA